MDKMKKKIKEFTWKDMSGSTSSTRGDKMTKKSNQPKDQQENWEGVEFPFSIDDGVLCFWERILPDGDWSGRTATIKDIKQFIKDLLADTREFYYQKGREEKAPMGVSQWRNHGKDNGYWEYFEKEEREQVIKEIEDRIKWEKSQGFNAIALEGDESLDEMITKLRDKK